jgi:hypothetical protein
MEKETEKAKEAFAIYQNLGEDRTVEKVASIMNKRVNVITNWKNKWKWDERIKEMNTTHSGDKNFESLINEHAELSLQISKSLETLIEALTEKLTGEENKLGDMNLDDLVKLINNYIKSIPQVLDYIQSYTLKPLHEKELEESFSICKKVSEDKVAQKLSLDILSRISN